jgi:D-amino-acid dehydrogenase
MLDPASPFYIKPRLDADLFAWAWRFWRASNAAHVRRAAPVIAEWSLASRACFDELAALPDLDLDFEKKGLAMLCHTAHALEEEAKTAETARRLGVPAEVLNADQAANLNPGARMAIAGAICFPMDCHLSPAHFVHALQTRLLKRGVTFVWSAEATRFRSEMHRARALVLADGREIEGAEFVLCGGTWSPDLVESLGLRLPMQAGKGYTLTLKKPHHPLSLPCILTEARVAATPMGDSLRVGGTMEIAGRALDVGPARIRGIVESFCRYFPDYTPQDFADLQPWVGLRPCSPDGLPYVGRTAALGNLSLATGHAMMGLSLAPITGQRLAALLAGEPPHSSLSLFSPDRYSSFS